MTANLDFISCQHEFNVSSTVMLTSCPINYYVIWISVAVKFDLLPLKLTAWRSSCDYQSVDFFRLRINPTSLWHKGYEFTYR